MAIAVFVGTVLKLKRSKLDSIEAGLAAVAEAVVEAVVAELCVVLTSFSLFEAATEVVIVTVEFVFFVISFGLCLSLKENKNIFFKYFHLQWSNICTQKYIEIEPPNKSLLDNTFF